MLKKLFNVFKKETMSLDDLITIKDCGTHVKITFNKPIVIETDKPIIIDSTHMIAINSRLLHENPYKGNKIPFNNETQFNEINNDLTQKYAKSLRMKEIYEKNMRVYNEDFDHNTEEDCKSCSKQDTVTYK